MKKIFTLATVLLVMLGISVTNKSALVHAHDDNHTHTHNGEYNWNHDMENNNGHISYIDNYIEQELMSDSEKERYQTLIDNGLAPEQEPAPEAKTDITTLSNRYTDNEHADNKEKGANKVSYFSGSIQGTLHLNSGWTQFLHGVRERDEDYYRFSLREKLTMKFNFTNPANYYIRILRYSESSEKRFNPQSEFVCSSQGSFAIELNPATYFIHVYSNTNDISSSPYHIYYYGERTSNHETFCFNETNKSNYGMLVWENELWPINSTRWKYSSSNMKRRIDTRRQPDVNDGYVDPMFFQNESNEIFTDEVFLESIMHIWDKDILNELRLHLQKIHSEIKSVYLQRSITQAEVRLTEELTETGANLVISLLAFIPGLNQVITIYQYTTDIYSFASQALRGILVDGSMLDEIDTLFWIGRLSEACRWASEQDKAVVRIPRYYWFEKSIDPISNHTIEITYWRRKSSFTKQ